MLIIAVGGVWLKASQMDHPQSHGQSSVTTGAGMGDNWGMIAESKQYGDFPILLFSKALRVGSD